MKRIKVWIATLSLLLVLTTMILPTHALADLTPKSDQGVTQPAPPPPPPPPPIDWIAILAGIFLAL